MDIDFSKATIFYPPEHEKSQYVIPGRMFLGSLLEDDILRLIGLVATQWGELENTFDLVIDILAHAVPGISEDGWERHGFKRRKKLLRSLYRSAFEKNPQIIDFFDKITNRSGELYWRRNIVVHGRFAIAFSDKRTPPMMPIASGMHNGKLIEIDIVAENLESMWHEISHMRGAIESAFNDFSLSYDHDLPSQDRLLLQDVWKNNHPQGPNRSKL